MDAGCTVMGMSTEQESRWSLSSTGNRIMWSVVVGLLTFVALRNTALLLLAGVVAYLLLTAIVSTRRGS